MIFSLERERERTSCHENCWFVNGFGFGNSNPSNIYSILTSKNKSIFDKAEPEVCNDERK
jgi:hypothetical protein